MVIWKTFLDIELIDQLEDNDRMRRIISRYIGANFVLPFMVSVLFFVSFLLTFQLLRITKLVINKGVPLVTIFELVGHMALSFLPMAIPLSVLFATLYSLSRMSADSEYIAMRSFGFSRFKILSPFLMIALLISLGSFAMNQSIIPMSKKEFKRAIIILTSKGFLADIQPGKFFTSIPGITLFSKGVSDKGTSLRQVFIHSAKHGSEDESVIFARSGKIIKKNPNKWGHSALHLKLWDGNILKQKGKEEEKILFKSYDFPISDGNISAILVTKDNMRTSRELFTLMNLSDEDKKKRNISNKANMKTKIEFYSRINTPILALIFTFLGFVLGVQRTRGRSMNSGLLCMVILVIYYTLYFGGISVARDGTIPPFVAVFLPSILSVFVAFLLYRKMEYLA